MKDIEVSVYGKINSVQPYPESYEEYDKLAATSAFVRARERDKAAWRAKILKIAANTVEAESGVKQGTSKRGDKEVITESPTAYFDRLTATEDEEGNEVASLVSLDVIKSATDKAASELALVSVLTPERVAGGSSIPACSEGVRARLQAIIDKNTETVDVFADRCMSALQEDIEDVQAKAEKHGKTFKLPQKTQEVLDSGDYEDPQFLDAYVNAANLADNFRKQLKGTNIVRSKS